jgi:TRAP transporter TAXI family solute receptor
MGHLVISLVAETVIEETGIPVRTIPNATYLGRAYMARVGTTHTTIEVSPGMYYLQEGMFEYAGYDWGPQAMGYLYTPPQNGYGLAVSADSPITDGSMLKGAKIGRFPGSPGLDQSAMALLAFFDVYEEDIISVEFPGPVAAWDAVIEGRIDTTFMDLLAGKTAEMEAKVGLRWLEMPASDTEGWARSKAVVPGVAPRTSGIGAGTSKENPVELQTSAYPAFAAYHTLDPDIAYWITKFVWELYPEYSLKHDALKECWTHEFHWQLWEGEKVPLHEGAIRYFKEIGEWNDTRDKMQQERLEHQAELKALWDKTVAEAIAQGHSAKEFPAFWMQARAVAGF